MARVVRIRIQADDAVDANDARRLLEELTGKVIKLRKPQEGKNPKYAGNQAWASYGTFDIEDLLLVVDKALGQQAQAQHRPPATGATTRVTALKKKSAPKKKAKKKTTRRPATGATRSLKTTRLK